MPNDAKLLGLLHAIFEDDVVDVAERSSLLELQSELDARVVRSTFAAFVDEKWGEAMADGVLTTHEKLVLQRVLEELDLPPDAIPLQVRLALKPR